MRLLITGGGGMLAHDLLAAASARGDDVRALARSKLDVTDAEAVSAAVRTTRPDAVINCAAYTDVDGAEADEAAALAVNGRGAGNVARAAAAVGAHLLHVSTDYVFDGSKRTPYLESDPVHPLSAYGRSKFAGEQAVAAAAPERHTIVRTAWLFGTGGPCFPATILRLAGERDQLSVVEDQTGCPTYTGHLAPALLELCRRPLSGVVHLTAGGETSWYGFAAALVRGVGAACGIAPCTTAEFPRPAPRPAYSVLRTARAAEGVPRLPDWHEGVEGYLRAAVPVG